MTTSRSWAVLRSAHWRSGTAGDRSRSNRSRSAACRPDRWCNPPKRTSTPEPCPAAASSARKRAGSDAPRSRRGRSPPRESARAPRRSRPVGVVRGKHVTHGPGLRCLIHFVRHRTGDGIARPPSSPRHQASTVGKRPRTTFACRTPHPDYSWQAGCCISSVRSSSSSGEVRRAG